MAIRKQLKKKKVTAKRNWTPNAKITMKKANEIRRLRKRGIPLKDIAERFNIHVSGVSRISRNESWCTPA